jgi:hypothetical protein
MIIGYGDRMSGFGSLTKTDPQEDDMSDLRDLIVVCGAERDRRELIYAKHHGVMWREEKTLSRPICTGISKREALCPHL